MAVNIYLDGDTDQIFDIQSAGTAGARIGELSDLETTNKTTVVSAINELVDTKANGTGLTFTVSDGILTCTY